MLVLVRCSSGPLGRMRSLAVVPFFVDSGTGYTTIVPISLALVGVGFSFSKGAGDPSVFRVSSCGGYLSSVPFLVRFSVCSMSLEMFGTTTGSGLIGRGANLVLYVCSVVSRRTEPWPALVPTEPGAFRGMQVVGVLLGSLVGSLLMASRCSGWTSSVAVGVSKFLRTVSVGAF